MKINVFATLTIIFLLNFSILAFGQEFDESFLSSLPEDIREELLKNQSSLEKNDEIQYRRPTSTLPKEDDADDIKTKSNRFGVTLFNSMQSSFMPVNEPNVQGDYVLDFGDVLQIQVIGQNPYTKNFDINRDGSINLLDAGKIYIAGLTLIMPIA